MTTFNEFLQKEGRVPQWPYPLRYGQEQVIETDVLILGGGIAGCWAAISAARKGLRVAIIEKSATIGVVPEGLDAITGVIRLPIRFPKLIRTPGLCAWPAAMEAIVMESA